MADVNVSLDSSDIPVIIEALESMQAALEEENYDEPHPAIKQIDLLINTFKSVAV
jgi:hypothetical protein